jgi:hypothetical protein
MQGLRRLIERMVRALLEGIQRCIPPYAPGEWNDFNGIQFSNNCYNYACNLRTDTFAQPGRATGHMYQAIDCRQVGAGAVSDGLIGVEADKGCGCADCQHRVALVIAPGYDYHWYRLDRDGRWSHKPGGTAATNLDNSGHAITDPRTADRGPYTVFCGFYCVKKSTVTIN